MIALLRELAAAKKLPKRGRVVSARTGDKLHSLGRTWRRLRELAGMPDLRIHDLRHSVASDAIMQGVPPRLPPPPETQAPSRVAIKAEYIPEIQRAAQILRPSPAANREEMLIGTVEILSGVVGPDGRRSGEVQFSVFLPDSDPLRVRANLDPEQYADAVRAHESDRAYVRLHGVLHRGQRVGRIDPLRALQLLDEQAISQPANND